jgi:hypothetical protein
MLPSRTQEAFPLGEQTMAEVELPNPEEVHEHSKDHFTRRVALTVACFAVALAITSVAGNNAAKEMMLAQQQSSNQWAYFQAKSIRESEYRIQRMRLELDLVTMPATAKPQAEKLLATFVKGEERYGKEKGDIEQLARDLEKKRDLNVKKDPYFDFAEVLLQIAIVMASVAMLGRSRPIYWFSISLALFGILFSLNGFALLVNIPFLGE